MTPATRRVLHHAERRVKGWPVQLWRFWTAPLTDKPDYDLSLTRLLAIGIFILVWHTVEKNSDHSLTANHVVLLVLVMAAAFGKATFTFFLTKWHGESTSADTTNVTKATSTTVNIDEKITHDIQERRGGGTFEATP